MGYRFADTGDWNKQAFGGFMAALIAVVTTLMTVQRSPDMGLVFFFLGLIPVLVGIIRGIHYMNRSSQDYVYLTPNELEVNCGPLLSAKRANYYDIDYCIELHDYDRRLITIKPIDGKEINFWGEWLTENDFVELKNELVKRTRNDKLFRFRTNNRVL
jgi:hypothetical protein